MTTENYPVIDSETYIFLCDNSDTDVYYIIEPGDVNLNVYPYNQYGIVDDEKTIATLKYNLKNAWLSSVGFGWIAYELPDGILSQSDSPEVWYRYKFEKQATLIST